MPYDRAQIVTELELGIRYLQGRCPPLKGFEYAIRWHEHELGTYADICLVWGEDSVPTPWDLIESAQRALEIFNEAVDWSTIWQAYDEGEEDDNGTSDGNLEGNPDEDPEFEEHRDDRCSALRQNLRLKVGYDLGKIDQLIAMERERTPNSTEEELLAAAIERWERDNR